MQNVILASASPRRKELLEQIGLSFTVLPSDFDESRVMNEEKDTEQMVLKISSAKAESVAAKVNGVVIGVVIGADTVVSIKGEVLGKPENEERAVEMLSRLSGKTHTVYTGVTIINIGSGRKISFAEKTDVFMRHITSEEIFAYVRTGEPMDKAGAYGAQGKGARFIERIEGDYFNVVGLPICRLVCELKNFGVEIM
ncbi:septum formation inhibitor Maf [Clostridia bacterium]|nr:septum formation inhibitor Maf [Clostridia bacterium]